ncbi:Fe(3+) ABC transporter substrate-binding protein [Paenibacillus sp. LHD-117]|uniref:Fe(3+) ABC transporter substrate-binding protein n=1 Tax=Paenibacillus sp. LHD-117 TaxID=3071412 RepID=UPI0027DF85C2|nr:Fe(3+) ABC transporter substrate-binding protein [Paenibacillus sp. LHD-117]MDQ6423240.1 Fe(3+) ABC transporter substrate-binding protein [Paenibacillus sp. LHD-117]
MKRLLIVTAICVFCVVLGLIGSELQPDSRSEGQTAASRGKQNTEMKNGFVTVYTARHYEADPLLFEAFTKKTGIEVVEIKGTAEELIARMKRDGDRSDADLFFAVDGGVLNVAKRENVLQPLRSETLDSQVPAKWRDPDHYWTGVATRARVIVYAKDRVKPEELSTYEDLTDEKWRGRVLARSYASLYNQSLLASFIALNGADEAERWARGIVANFARTPEGGDRDQAQAIADGIGDVAIMNTYYVGQLAASSDPDEAQLAEGLGVFFPNQETTGTHLNISGIGLARYSENRDNALKLMEYLTSKEGQTLLARESFEFPVNLEAEAADPLRSWGTFKAQRLDFADLEQYRQEAIGIFDKAGWK